MKKQLLTSFLLLSISCMMFSQVSPTTFKVKVLIMNEETNKLIPFEVDNNSKPETPTTVDKLTNLGIDFELPKDHTLVVTALGKDNKITKSGPTTLVFADDLIGNEIIIKHLDEHNNLVGNDKLTFRILNKKAANPTTTNTTTNPTTNSSGQVVTKHSINYYHIDQKTSECFCLFRLGQ